MELWTSDSGGAGRTPACRRPGGGLGAAWPVCFFAILLSLPIAPAAAQVPGTPMVVDPFLSSDGVDDSRLGGVGHTGGGAGSTFLMLGLRHRLKSIYTLQALGGLAHTWGAGDDRTIDPQLGLAWDVAVLERSITIGLHNGVGFRSTRQGDLIALPLGVGVTWFIPIIETGAGPPLALWALPRFELLRRTGGGVSSTDGIWAASVGIGLGSSDGLGFSLAADYRGFPEDGLNALLPTLPEWSFALMLRLRS